MKGLAGQEQAQNEQWVCRACRASLSPSGLAPIWPQRGSAGSTDPLLILGLFLPSQPLETKIGPSGPARKYGRILDAFLCSYRPSARIAKKVKIALSQAISLRRAVGLQKSISQNLSLGERSACAFVFLGRPANPAQAQARQTPDRPGRPQTGPANPLF